MMFNMKLLLYTLGFCLAQIRPVPKSKLLGTVVAVRVTGQVPFLSPNQQRLTTEGSIEVTIHKIQCWFWCMPVSYTHLTLPTNREV